MNPDRQRTSSTAIASLALACGSVLLGPLGAIPAIILGFVALREISRDRYLSGKPLAIAGIALGFAFMALLFIACIVWLLLSWSVERTYRDAFKDAGI